MAAAYAGKAQALVQRGAELVRTVAPQVKASYAATMAKNAGAPRRAGAAAGELQVACGRVEQALTQRALQSMW